MALRLKKVSYTYGEGTPFAQRALDEVDLSVEPGTLTLLVGATGSGKSTLLRVACGLMPPQSGSVELDGRVVTHAETGKDGIGVVFQSPEAQLFAETVIADVAFGPRNQGLDEDEALVTAAEAMRRVGLDPDVFGERSPFSLSGGEARRAALAGVLALGSSYLLLDEPTAGLDASGRSAVMGIVEELRHSTGIVVATHDIEEFLPHADQVLILESGRAVACLPAEEVVSDPYPLEDAGLSIPDILAVQAAARDAGLDIPGFTLEPMTAARMVAEAGGWA